MKKTKLKLSDQYSYDYLVYGISSYENDLKMLWNINATLGIKLKLDESIKKVFGDEVISFKRYTQEDENDGSLLFQLMVNKYGRQHLIKGYKNIDYMFMAMSGIPETDNDGENLLYRLRTVNNLTAVYKLELDKKLIRKYLKEV